MVRHPRVALLGLCLLVAVAIASSCSGPPVSPGTPPTETSAPTPAPGLPRLKAEEVIRVLQRHGFVLVSQRGSHQKWRHPDSGKQIIVPYHKGKQLPLGTLCSVVEGSAIPEDDFRQ